MNDINEVVKQTSMRVVQQLVQDDALWPRWMNSKVAAAYTGVSHHRLAKLRERRSGPPYLHFGRTVVYDRAELDQYMEELKQRERGRV